jgi:hypothetical protein
MTTFRHRVQGTGAGGELWVSTLHSVSTGTLAAAHAAFHTMMVALFTGELAALYNANQGMTGTVTDQLDPANDKNVAQASTGATHVGTATDTPSSPRACLVIGLTSATPTRHGRGRMFFPAPTAASITAAGALNATPRAAIASDFGARLTTFSATATPVIWTRAKGVGARPFTTYVPGSAGGIVTGVSVGTTLGTQRRRTNKTPQTYSTATV